MHKPGGISHENVWLAVNVLELAANLPQVGNLPLIAGALPQLAAYLDHLVGGALLKYTSWRAGSTWSPNAQALDMIATQTHTKNH